MMFRTSRCAKNLAFKETLATIPEIDVSVFVYLQLQDLPLQKGLSSKAPKS